ncbi:MAG: hypothetical protein QOE83_1877 [Actinomycetota bacterium]|jgi:hypothetical protein|nr:hypothetical protein [Actinomycetota bacterium]
MTDSLGGQDWAMSSALTRRELLAALGVVGLGTIAASCTGRSSAVPPPNAGSLEDLGKDASKIQMIGAGDPVNPGKQTMSFFLATDSGLVTEAAPKLWLAMDRTSKAAGPFAATWYPLLGYDKTHDHSPRSPLAVGVYSAEVDFPSAGNWTLAAEVTSETRSVGTQVVPVVDSGVVAALGSKATSVPTPVATTRHGLAEICTRTPPDHMHYISLDEALNNGKPTVVSFSTPLLCEAQMCGPTVDEQILIFDNYGPDRANFIHVEEFLPGPDLKPPPASPNNLAPAFKAWGFVNEPWVIIIDAKGVIRSRLGPGVAAAGQIDAALSPLL